MIENQKKAWYILDEIAVKCSSSHERKYCRICERAVEAMRLLEKPSHQECQELFMERN